MTAEAMMAATIERMVAAAKVTEEESSMARTFEYVVYRAGSTNTANSLGPVVIVTAKNRDEAVEIAAAGSGAVCYNGQYLTAKPRSRASADDVNDAILQEEYRDQMATELEWDASQVWEAAQEGGTPCAEH